MKPNFQKMMKKLSENNEMMMMEYAAFFQKEVEANYVPRSWAHSLIIIRVVIAYYSGKPVAYML